MKRMIAWLSFLLILLGLTGCDAPEKVVPELLDPVGVQLDTAVVKRGTVSRLETYDGEVIPYVEELHFISDGRLAQIHVLAGDTVKAGQVLASLDEESILAKIETLETKIAEVKKLGTFSDRQSNAEIGIAEVELNRLKAEGASQQEIDLKKLEIQQLELDLKHARQLRNLELEENQRKLDALQASVGQGQILAPFDGRIVYVRDIKKGASVRGYTTVMCIVDETRLSLVSDFVTESAFNLASRVYAKIGDKEYEIEYLPYDPVEYATLIFGGETVKARYTLKDQSLLKGGEYAAVMVYSIYKEDVLTVPTNSLYREGSQWYVYKMDGDVRTRCDITIGAYSGTNVEITDGLKEGDVVYVKN